MGSKKKYRKSFAEAVKSFDTKPQEEENVASDEMSADTLKKQVDKDIEEEIQELESEEVKEIESEEVKELKVAPKDSKTESAKEEASSDKSENKETKIDTENKTEKDTEKTIEKNTEKKTEKKTTSKTAKEVQMSSLEHEIRGDEELTGLSENRQAGCWW